MLGMWSSMILCGNGLMKNTSKGISPMTLLDTTVKGEEGLPWKMRPAGASLSLTISSEMILPSGFNEWVKRGVSQVITKNCLHGRIITNINQYLVLSVKSLRVNEIELPFFFLPFPLVFFLPPFLFLSWHTSLSFTVNDNDLFLYHRQW